MDEDLRLAENNSAAPKQDPLAARQLRICISLFYSMIVLSPLAISFGAKQIPIAWFVGLAHFGILAILTRCVVDFGRLLAVATAFCVITLETATVHTAFSATSLLYIAGIYAPLAFVASRLDPGAIRTLWKHVSILAAIVTCCGLVQMAGQLLRPGFFLDPLRLLPESLLLQGYHTTYPITYGAWLLKPNGMFMLEPSFFSQIIALGLLSEFVFFKRMWLILLFAVGLAASFSGTGLIMLLPALLFVGSFRVIVGFTLLAVLLVGVLAALGYGDILVARATETRDTGSSGNMRFVAPYQEMVDGWQEKPAYFLFGKGAGAAERMSTSIEANFGPIPKVGVEYGIVGLIAFALVWLSMFWRLALPPALVVALMIFYFLASGSFLQPFSIFTIWALSGGLLRQPGKAATLPRPVSTTPALT